MKMEVSLRLIFVYDDMQQHLINIELLSTKIALMESNQPIDELEEVNEYTTSQLLDHLSVKIVAQGPQLLKSRTLFPLEFIKVKQRKFENCKQSGLVPIKRAF